MSTERYEPTGCYLNFQRTRSISVLPNVQFDDRGLPMVSIRRGPHTYHPVSMAQWGLHEHCRFLTSGDSQHRDNAIRAADWFVSTQDPASGAWFYTFDFHVGGFGVTLHAPWISAMAQGQAISLLVRMFAESSDVSYLTAAERALAPLSISTQDGGVLTDFFGHPFFEEYPTEIPNFTLNGFMFCLVGLYDLSTIAPASAAPSLWQSGKETLRFALPFFDLGNVTAYHLGHLTNPPRPVTINPGYHPTHVMQLQAIASTEAETDTVLSFYADRWANYDVTRVS